MIRPERRQACGLALITAFVLLLATPLAAVPEIEWLNQARTPAAVPAGPALPDLPVQLMLDDGTFETVFGVGGVTARQFLWFTQFALPPGAQNLSLQEIWVLFPPGANMAVGDAIELVVYQDFDGDPTNGATLLATVNETIQTLDGTTFSVYSIPPVEIVGGGEVLIGVVSRFIESGVTPFPTLPAAVDASVSDGSGWFATWVGDPPNPPELPSDLVMQPFNASFAGVWMIRGFGRPIPDFQVIPTAGTWGLMFLALALALVALRALRGMAAVLISVLAAGMLVLPAPNVHATVIDDFSTDQGPVSGSLGAPDSDNASAGLGGDRDLDVSVERGRGLATAEVTGGALGFVVDETTPDTRGEVVVRWDGVNPMEGPAMVNPTGLGGVDLTLDGGVVQTGLALGLTTTDTGVEATIFIYTDAANQSRIDLVLVSGQTGYVLGFDDFVPSMGAGADFANVGAIVLILRGTEKSVTVDRLTTTAPVVTGLLSDAVLPAGDADMDGAADPGDTLRYTATISNTGTEADQVDINEMLTDLALVGGSVRTTPVARNDRYDDEACGNVTLTVAAAQGVLANDFDIDTNALGVDLAMSDTASIQGGTVTMAADGGFVYNPPPGFGGVDSFSYQLAVVAGDPTPPAPIRGTVTVLIDERVWFVDNSHGGADQGTQADPFQTLAGVEAVAAAGDTIFIFEGTGTTAGLDTGLVLEDDQTLLGHGVDLVACGQTLVPASTRPIITHAAGVGVTLANNNEIRGLNIGATNMRGISGNGFGTATLDEIDLTDAGAEALHLTNGTLAATIGTLSSANSGTGGVFLDGVGGTLTANSTTVTDPTGAGITIQNLPSGAAHDLGATMVTMAGSGGTPGHGVRVASNHSMATVTFSSLSITTENGPGFEAPMGGIVDIESTGASVMATGGPAVNINATTGRTSGSDGWTFATLSSVSSPIAGVVLTALPVNFTVGTSTTVTDATGTGILPTNNAGRTLSFSATSVMDTNVGGGATGNGVDLRTGNAGATFNFLSLSVVADAGFGVAANNSGTINVSGGGTGVAATGGPALDATATAMVVNFAGLSSANSPTTGVNLVNVTGSLNVSGGSIMNATGVAFNVGTGAASSGGNVAVTYTGSITNTADRAVSIQRRTGGTVTLSGNINETGTGLLVTNNSAGTSRFSGSSKIVNTGASTGVTLTSNTGHTIELTGGGLDVDTNGAVGISAMGGGTLQIAGAGNSVATVGGIAVDINGVTLATVGGGPPTTHGVVLASVAASGGMHGLRLVNTGTGGFRVTGTGGANSGGLLTGATNDGVSLTNAHNVHLTEMRVATSGDDGVSAAMLTNVTLDSVTVDGTQTHGVNAATVTNLTMNNGSEIANAGNADEEHGMKLADLFGNSLIEDTTIRNMEEDGIELINDDVDDGSIDVVTVRNSMIRDNNAAGFGENGILVRAQDNGNLRLVIDGTTIRDNAGDAINGAADGADNNGFLDLRVIGATLEDNGARAIAVGTANNQDADVRILDGTTISGNITTPIAITGNQSGVLNVTIDNTTGMPANDITITGSQNVVGGVGARCMEITADDDVDMAVLVSDVTASECDFAAIRAISRNTANMDLTLRDSDFTTAGTGFEEAVTIVAGVNTAGDTGAICLNMFGNTANTGGGFLDDYRLRTRVATNVFQLQDFVGNGANAGDVQTWVNTTKSNTGTALITISAPFSAAPGPCQLPPS